MKARAGKSLLPVVDGMTIPSVRHKDKLIKYRTYSSEPGMIYWGYINNPKPDLVAEPEMETEKESEINIDWGLVGGYVLGGGIILYGILWLINTGDPSVIQKGVECIG